MISSTPRFLGSAISFLVQPNDGIGYPLPQRFVLGQSTLDANSTNGWFGNLVLAAPEWIPVSITICTILLVIILWNASKMKLPPQLIVLSVALKLIAVGLICLCVVQPMRRGERARPQENLVAIMLDSSQSMQLKAPGESTDRLNQFKTILDPKQDWQTRLQQDFDVRKYRFGRRLDTLTDVSQVEASETSSSLLQSLHTLQRRLDKRPLAGVMLFTDGNLTDQDFADWNATDFPAPIYPVVNDDEPVFQDVCIERVMIQQTDFETSPAKVEIQYRATGLEKETTTIQLIDLQTGKLVEEASDKIIGSDHIGKVSFRFRPETSGVSFFEVLAFTELDREAILNPTVQGIQQSTEATLLNNAQIVSIDRKSGPYRLLYLSGRPNWEYKFLRRSLQADAEVQLVGLIRIAKKEPKFSFRDRSVSSTNPLFAGLGKDEEDAAEQYDEPVIIRLGVKESEELSDGFPTTEEELFAYHGIILDDLEGDFFSQDQLLLLRKFVSSRGGGLLMLGGQEAFSTDALRETPLGELAPFYPTKQDTKPPGPYRLQLTKEGMLQPWLRLSDNETDELRQTRTGLIHSTLNQAGELKPGASILANAETRDQNQFPALISQRFGRGRSAAWMIGDLWRSSMRRMNTEDDSAGQAWRQMARWLVNDAPSRVEVTIRKPDNPNAPIAITTAVRDETYLPMDNAKVAITVTPLLSDPITLEAEMDADQSGIYRTEYWSADGSAFHVTAKVDSLDGVRVGEAETGWTQNAGAEEFRQLSINRDGLEELAKATGGRVIRTSDLNRFSQDLPNQRMPISETWLYPLWHSPWILTLAIACLCLEWTVRRLRGMA